MLKGPRENTAHVHVQPLLFSKSSLEDYTLHVYMYVLLSHQGYSVSRHSAAVLSSVYCPPPSWTWLSLFKLLNNIKNHPLPSLFSLIPSTHLSILFTFFFSFFSKFSRVHVHTCTCMSTLKMYMYMYVYEYVHVHVCV